MGTKSNKRKDFTQVAFNIVQQATEDKKSPPTLNKPTGKQNAVKSPKPRSGSPRSRSKN
jgi:hypothetical protein